MSGRKRRVGSARTHTSIGTGRRSVKLGLLNLAADSAQLPTYLLWQTQTILEEHTNDTDGTEYSDRHRASLGQTTSVPVLTGGDEQGPDGLAAPGALGQRVQDRQDVVLGDSL